MDCPLEAGQRNGVLTARSCHPIAHVVSGFHHRVLLRSPRVTNQRQKTELQTNKKHDQQQLDLKTKKQALNKQSNLLQEP